ncbi:hypothetical protein D3C75_637390 [compost metagenome]
MRIDRNQLAILGGPPQPLGHYRVQPLENRMLELGKLFLAGELRLDHLQQLSVLVNEINNLLNTALQLF